MGRYLFPLILGLGGIAILLALGIWQVRRLEVKEAMLARIEAMIAAAPVDLATLSGPSAQTDRYRAVTVAGQLTGEEILVLTGLKDLGAGYEVIAVLQTPDGRRLLVDRGFVAQARRDSPRPAGAVEITGNLDWPNEADAYTPPPDPATGIWFARDVAAMAAQLKTDAIMVVLRGADGRSPDIVPRPVDTAAIKNDHLHYAITWFSLAAVWTGMTGFLLWRIRRRTS